MMNEIDASIPATFPSSCWNEIYGEQYVYVLVYSKANKRFRWYRQQNGTEWQMVNNIINVHDKMYAFVVVNNAINANPVLYRGLVYRSHHW